MRHAIGMMSGTSADGIDAVLLRDAPNAPPTIIAHATHTWPPSLQQALLDAGTESARLSAAEWSALDAQVAAHYAEAVQPLLDEAAARDIDITVIGMHGQTVAHDPPHNSLQIGNPAAVATAAGVPVVADLRRGDLALGGQGAPLASAFHARAFGHPAEPRAVVNIGGIANLTWLPPGGNATGFDTGPGNGLMDAWHQRHRGGAFDDGGAWAASGRVIDALLDAWLRHPFFALPPPRSTGRGAFNLERLFALAQPPSDSPPEDVQATLLALTVRGITGSLHLASTETPAHLYVCGGGAHNGTLMQALAGAVAPVPVDSTGALGLPPQQVEAATFAWLALRRWDGLPGTLASVTGARRDAVSGGLYLPG